MAGPFPNDEQLTLERFLIKPFSSSNHYLIKVRHRATRRWPNIRCIWVNRQLTPTDELLPLLIDNSIHYLATASSLCRVCRHEEDAASVQATPWQFLPKLFLSYSFD
jgi:hypothetical protein